MYDQDLSTVFNSESVSILLLSIVLGFLRRGLYVSLKILESLMLALTSYVLLCLNKVIF